MSYSRINNLSKPHQLISVIDLFCLHDSLGLEKLKSSESSLSFSSGENHIMSAESEKKMIVGRLNTFLLETCVSRTAYSLPPLGWRFDMTAYPTATDGDDIPSNILCDILCVPSKLWLRVWEIFLMLSLIVLCYTHTDKAVPNWSNIYSFCFPLVYTTY